MYKVIFYLF